MTEYIKYLILLSLSCIGQVNVFPLYEPLNNDYPINGAYYKDMSNFHDQFVGTWVFDDGTTYLKVCFIKKNMHLENFAGKIFYTDYLIGEYEYKVNGITVFNSLNNLSIVHSNIFNYNLYSFYKANKKTNPNCFECSPNEYRMIMAFQELPSRDSATGPNAHFILRKIFENGVEKLKVQFYMTFPALYAEDDAHQGFSLPFGNYVLTKQ